MKIISFFLLFICLCFLSTINAQKEVRVYSFLNSLKDYAGGEGTAVEVPGPSTKVPVWMGRMAAEAGNIYKTNAQFGFVDGWLNDINNLGGPNVQLGYEADGVQQLGATENNWPSYANANVTDTSFTPGNFFQWASYTERTGFYVDIINAIETNAPTGSRYWVYYGLPPFDAFGGDIATTTPAQYAAWQEYALGEYQIWGENLVADINNALPGLATPVTMIPISKLFVFAMRNTTLSTLMPSDLFVDGAPHGGQTMYLLAAMINYMYIFDEQPPNTMTIDPLVHSLLRDNYQLINDYLWAEIQNLPVPTYSTSSTTESTSSDSTTTSDSATTSSSSSSDSITSTDNSSTNSDTDSSTSTSSTDTDGTSSSDDTSDTDGVTTSETENDQQETSSATVVSSLFLLLLVFVCSF